MRYGDVCSPAAALQVVEQRKCRASAREQTRVWAHRRKRSFDRHNKSSFPTCRHRLSAVWPSRPRPSLSARSENIEVALPSLGINVGTGGASNVVGRVVAWLSAILSVLSIVALIAHGLDYGLGPTTSLLLEYYDRLLQVLLGWSEPSLQRVLRALGDYLYWEPLLHPYWKHVFLLMFAYLGREASLAASLGANRWWRLALGLVLALVAALGAGALPASRDSNLELATFVAGPALCILLYDFAIGLFAPYNFQSTLTHLLRFHGRRLGARLLGGGLVTTALLCVPVALRSEGYGIVILGALLLLQALCLIVLSMREQMQRHPFSYEASHRDGVFRRLALQLRYLKVATFSSPEAGLGFSIIGVFAGVLLFVLTNAGLQLVGL